MACRYIAEMSTHFSRVLKINSKSEEISLFFILCLIYFYLTTSSLIRIQFNSNETSRRFVTVLHRCIVKLFLCVFGKIIRRKTKKIPFMFGTKIFNTCDLFGIAIHLCQVYALRKQNTQIH